MRDASTRFSTALRYRDGEHPAQAWFTPDYVLAPVRVDLGGEIDLDPCTTANNPTDAAQFYTVDHDGLSRNWHALSWRWLPTIYCNPPYSRAREPWVERCIEAGARGQRVILLIPAATDTRIWQKAVSTATAVVFIKGRVKFGVPRPNGRQVAASHPSSLIGWNTTLDSSAMLGLRVVA